jgi:NitT/TauT family transport system permease protein
MFKLQGELSKTQSIILGIAGFVFLILVWWLIAETRSERLPVYEAVVFPESTLGADDKMLAMLDSLQQLDSTRAANATAYELRYPIIPRPDKVIKIIPEMIKQDHLFSNTLLSLWRNIQGYIWAILIAVPFGFLLGLLPFFKGLFSRPVDALRFLPLTALTGVFMLAFGTQEEMKVTFLAFGIFVYLLPVVVQRVREVSDVYLKTTFTLGASDWQTIRTVYLPSVMSRLVEDIRVLTAISWTYIIIAELLNKEGGIGALMYTSGRQGLSEKVFAGLFVIILVGFMQDYVFSFIQKRLFPYKHFKSAASGIKESQTGIYVILVMLFALVMMALITPDFAASILRYSPILLITGLIIIVMGEIKIFQHSSNNQ